MVEVISRRMGVVTIVIGASQSTGIIFRVIVSLTKVLAFRQILLCQWQRFWNCIQFTLSGRLRGSVIVRRIDAMTVNIRPQPLHLIAIPILRRTAEGWVVIECDILRMTRKKMYPGIQLSGVLISPVLSCIKSRLLICAGLSSSAWKVAGT